MSKKIAYFLSFVVILGLVISIPLAVKLVKQRQEVRKEAAVPGGTARMSLSGADSVNIGESLPITVSFQTPTTPNNLGIGSIRLILFYNFTGQNPLELQPNNITSSLPGPWNYQIKTVTPGANMVLIDVEAIYQQAGETGYLDAVSQPQNFAVLNFTGAAAGTVDLEFNVGDTAIISKDGDSLDILGVDLPSKTITVGGGGATATPTSTPTPTPTGSAHPTSTPTPTPTATSSPTPGGSATATPTATPTPTPGGQGGPAPTPTPSALETTTTITYPASGATVTTAKPTFSGKTVSRATIDITVNSPILTASVAADVAGNWSYTATTSIPNGSHTITIVAKDPNTNQTVTKSSSFNVNVAAAQQTTTTSGEIVAGNSLPTLLLLATGLLLFFLGLVPKIL